MSSAHMTRLLRSVHDTDTAKAAQNSKFSKDESCSDEYIYMLSHENKAATYAGLVPCWGFTQQLTLLHS